MINITNITNSPRWIYHSGFRDFVTSDQQTIFAALCQNYHGDALMTTREALKGEISILQELLKPWMEDAGQIVFEYDIPRLGKRIDVVLLLKGMVFCLKFKVGQKQVLQMPMYSDSIVNPLITGEKGLRALIAKAIEKYSIADEESIGKEWIISPYSPTPTIIEAARTLYKSHSVEDITRHEADKVSTGRTIAKIFKVIQQSKEKGEKSICFMTGVPEVDKTFVGLDVVVKQTYQGQDKPLENEGAVYLSGNGHLVAVLTETLAIDNYAKCKARGERKNKSNSCTHRYGYLCSRRKSQQNRRWLQGRPDPFAGVL